MTPEEIMELLINSESLKVSLLVPETYGDDDVEELKRAISRYKHRNKNSLESLLGKFVLRFSFKEDLRVLEIEIEQSRNTTHFDGVSLA